MQIVAEFWGVELQSGRAREACAELAALMLDPALAGEVVSSLPPECNAALDDLQSSGGRLPVAQFTRAHGEIRQMGPGRRDREQPWLEPVSAAEALWYHGLIARAFDDAPTGPQEFIFIPSDLRALLPSPETTPAPAPGFSFSLPSSFEISRASSALVDDSATLLAAFRINLISPGPRGAAGAGNLQALASISSFLLTPSAAPLVATILQDTGGLFTPTFDLVPDVVRPFLEARRGGQLAALFNAWRDSRRWNDLDHLPGLAREGQWHNDPVVARAAILSLLKDVPPETWWSLDSFVAALKERQPDFQRPAGDYDSWYLRDEQTGEYLRGFTNWDKVDGALVRWLIHSPLYWLGLTDLAADGSAFRVTRWGADLLAGKTPDITEPPGHLRIHADGRLTTDRALSRSARFQAARFCEWETRDDANSYNYRLTPKSLARAQSQGVTVKHILAFLSKAAANPIPPALEEALTRWEKRGVEATAADLLVLKVKTPEMLETLRKSSKTSRYLGEPLGPTAVEVKRRDWEKLRAAMGGMGILVDKE